MRALLLALLLVLPTAGALSVEAPPVAGAGLPFLVRVCAAPGDEVRVALLAGDDHLAANGTRYRPASPDACRDVVVEPEDVDANATLLVRSRPTPGEARLPLRLARVDVVSVAAERAYDARALRVPASAGRALVPLVPGADAEGGRVALLEAWGPPFEGVVLASAGPGSAALGGLAVEGVLLPDARIAPGQAIFVGARAPPGVLDALALDLALSGNVTLAAARHTLASLPPARAGEIATAEGARRMGRTSASAAPFAVEGRLLAYATPEAGEAPVVALLDGAREEALVEAYTLTSPGIAAALGRALDRGVRVRMLLEGAPVGGLPDAQGALLAALAARGAEVALLRSAEDFPARYRNLHAKVLVVDRVATLVATENLHESSYPPVPNGAGTRGYGLVVWNATLAMRVADLMDADAAPWPDVQPIDLEALPPPATLAARAGAIRGPAFEAQGRWNVSLVVSPDTSLALLDALRNATTTLDVQQLFVEPRFGTAEDPFLEALVEAARRGVRVRLLLDARLDDGRNAAVVARLQALAAREGLPMEARLADASRTVHAKLVLLDATRAYVGSMNWGRASAFDNREVGLLVEAPEVARWIGATFERDWRGEAAEAPNEAPLPAWVTVGALALALGLSRPRGPRRGPSRRR